VGLHLYICRHVNGLRAVIVGVDCLPAPPLISVRIHRMNKANQRQNTRHKAGYTAYFNNDTREKNKAYKLIRHLERHPTCKTAIAALERLPSFCVKSARSKLKKLRGVTQ